MDIGRGAKLRSCKLVLRCIMAEGQYIPLYTTTLGTPSSFSTLSKTPEMLSGLVKSASITREAEAWSSDFEFLATAATFHPSAANFLMTDRPMLAPAPKRRSTGLVDMTALVENKTIRPCGGLVPFLTLGWKLFLVAR